MKKIILVISLILLFVVVGCNNTNEANNGITAIVIEGSIQMHVGEIQDLVKKVYPENAYNSVDWISSDESVMTVEQGRVTALKEGTVEITAISRDGSNVTGSIAIVVGERAISKPTDVRLVIGNVEYRDGANIELEEFDEIEFGFKYLPNEDVKQGVYLSLTNDNVTIKDDKTLICEKPGSVDLYVFSKYGDIEHKYSIIINEKQYRPETIDIEASITSVETDMEFKVSASVFPERANQDVIWSTSDNTIATIDQFGNVKALKAGNVKIIATSIEINTVKSEYALTISQSKPFDKDNIYVNPNYKNIGEVVKVGEKSLTVGKDAQSTITGALDVCNDGATIYLAAGTYKEDINWNKNVTVIGPNENIVGYGIRSSEAKYQLSDKGSLISYTVKFIGIEIIGGGPEYYGATSGVYFKSDASTTKVEFENCYIHDMKTAIKFDKGSNLELSVTGCKVSNIGQFFIWTSGGMKKTTLIDNYVDASTSGQVENNAGTLIRIRSGVAFIYNNYFNGTPAKNAGLFENGSSDGNYEIKFNTFNNCKKYVYNNGSKPVIFDKNLYLDSNGVALSASPEAMKVGGVTPDSVVASSAEELAGFYAEFIK